MVIGQTGCCRFELGNKRLSCHPPLLPVLFTYWCFVSFLNQVRIGDATPILGAKLTTRIYLRDLLHSATLSQLADM